MSAPVIKSSNSFGMAILTIEENKNIPTDHTNNPLL
jgi:hypothetical protein